MDDKALADHLRALHAEQAEVLADIDAATKEVENRATMQVEAATIAALPENVRDMLGRATGLPGHVKHALVEAKAAGAGTAAHDAVVKP